MFILSLAQHPVNSSPTNVIGITVTVVVTTVIVVMTVGAVLFKVTLFKNRNRQSLLTTICRRFDNKSVLVVLGHVAKCNGIGILPLVKDRSPTCFRTPTLYALDNLTGILA